MYRGPCETDPKNKYIVHFPDEPSIWSTARFMAAIALLAKNARAPHRLHRRQKRSWMRTHAHPRHASPQGKKHYLAAASERLGKTTCNDATHGARWKSRCSATYIAWIRVGQTGGFTRLNPESGLWRCARHFDEIGIPRDAGHRPEHHFTNVALTPDGDVWWEDMGVPAPERRLIGKAANGRRNRTQSRASKLALYHARVAMPGDRSECRSEVVPLAAILFGGRRPARFAGERAVLTGARRVMGRPRFGKPRRRARRPVCCAAIHSHAALLRLPHGRLFRALVSFAQRTDRGKLPKIYFVNWFRKDGMAGAWPGYGENSRCS